MTKRKIKVIAKKTLAVLSSMAVLLSCCAAGTFSASAAVSDTHASGGYELGDAIKMYIYDCYGNLLTSTTEDSAIVYIDNSTKAAGNGEPMTETYVTVEIRSDEVALTDEILPPGDAEYDGTNFHSWITDYKVTEHTCSYRYHVKGYKIEYVNYSDPITGESRSMPVEVGYTPGRVTVPFQSKSGNVSDNLDVVTQEPATDITILRNTKALKLNEHSMYNTSEGLMLTENHKYKFSASLTTEHPAALSEYLDKVEWRVYDGILTGDMDLTEEELAQKEPSKIAEITQDGLLSTNDFGQVTIVATLKDTIKAEKDYARRLRAYRNQYPDPAADGVPAAPVYLSDRHFVQGKKLRNIYMPKVDPETHKLVLGEDGQVQYAKDEEGKLYILSLDMDTKIERPNYYTNGQNVVAAKPILDEYNNLKYIPNYNTPKYINLYIKRDNPATKIEFTKAPDSMLIGETFPIEITKTPTHRHEVDGDGYEAGATDEIEWFSTNPAVASVDSNGVVTALSKGETEIQAIGDKITATHKVVVRAKAKSIEITPRTGTTRVDVPLELTAKLDPADANEEVTWFSEDENIAVVAPAEGNGELTNIQKAYVTGVSIGSTNINARIVDPNNPNEYVEVRCLVEVKAKNLSDTVNLSYTKEKNIIPITDNSTVELFTSKELQIDARLQSQSGAVADDKVKWTLLGNDSSYVTVSEETTDHITLKGIAEGVVTVIASAEADDSVNKVFKVKVLRRCDNIVMTDYGTTTPVNGKNLNVGGSFELGAMLTVNGSRPDAHSDYISGFESSDPTIAEVEEITNDIGGVLGCKVTTKKIGTAYITATAASGAKTSMSVYSFTTSSVDIEGVTLDKETNTLNLKMMLDNDLNGALHINPIVKDHNSLGVYGSMVKWTSSDESVATITNSGDVTANNVGVTELTVQSGDKTESCVLTVYAPMTAVKFQTFEPIVFTPRLTSFVPDDLTFKTLKSTLVEGVDYTQEIINNTGVGYATITLHGQGYYQGDATTYYEIVRKSIEDNDVFIQYATRQECTGLPLTPEVKVFYDGMQLSTPEDYMLNYHENILPGIGDITITGNGSYNGTAMKKFEIFCDHKNLVNSTIVKQATYEENGLEVGTCAACGEQDVHNIIPKFIHSENPALSIRFVKNEYGLLPNESMTLVPICETKDNTGNATDIFRWESDDPLVVSVSDKGEIRGINAGKATITVRGENENVEASCVVAVLTKAESIEVTPETVETRVGVSTEIKATVEPFYMNDEIIWESDNNSVVLVQPSESSPFSAVITGQSVGNTTVTARMRYSDIECKIDVNVGERNASDVIAISTKIDDTLVPIPNSTETSEYTHRIYSNQDVVFTAAISNYSGKAADDVVVWQVSDNEGDTITLPKDDIDKDIIGNELNVHAASLGSCTITAFPQTNPELKTHFKLEVAKRCDNVTIVDEYDTPVSARGLNVGDHLSVHTILTTLDPNHPYDHGDEVRAWESSDPSIAEVDNSGYITAKKNGSAVITVKTRSGMMNAMTVSVFTTADVYLVGGVTKPEKDGDLPTVQMRMNNDMYGSAIITAQIYDQNNTPVYNAFCTWTSSNEDVAKVDRNGNVTGLSVGTSVITAKSGVKSQSCMVYVYAPVTAMKAAKIEDITYTPRTLVYKPSPQIVVGDKTLVEGVDYTIEYQNNERPGQAAAVVKGIGMYYEAVMIPFNILQRSLSDPLVVVDPIGQQSFTGDAITPDVHVTCDGIELVRDVDYVVNYTDNYLEGTGHAVISPVWGGVYSESRTVDFEIVKTFSNIYGDMDNDEEITAGDALTVLRLSADLEELTDEKLLVGDVDLDTVITAQDALEILRASIGMTSDTSYVGRTISAH